MDFTWDSQKDHWLRAQRFISFEEIAAKIQAHEYFDIIDNPSRLEQHCFILSIRDYTWVVPFVFDEHDRIVLKTAYPSRRFHRKYGGNKA